MEENSKDSTNFRALIGYVSSIETQLNRAIAELDSMQKQLSSIREGQEHPVKTVLEKAVELLETKVNETQKQLHDLKTKIIEGSKKAVETFRQKGISVLDSLAKFFEIKPLLESIQGNLENKINKNLASIAKINALSTEYRSLNRHLKNIGRVLMGKKPITEIKPNGILFNLISAPYRIEEKHLSKALNSVEKAIVSLDRLDKSIPPKAVSAEREGEKNSVLQAIHNFNKKAIEGIKETPIEKKPKCMDIEL